MTGNLNAKDPNGDPLSYTVSVAPAKGTVTATTNSRRIYLYKPSDAARDAKLWPPLGRAA